MRKLLLTFIVLGCSVLNIQAKVLDVGAPVVATTSGSTKSNLKQLTMIFSATFTGTVNGVNQDARAASTLNFYAYQSGDMLAPVVYTVTAGSITLYQVQ